MIANEDICEQIEEVIESIRPGFLVHGGDISFVKYKNGVVYVQLSGSCVGCPSSDDSIRMMVESELRVEVPQVERVESI